MDPRFDGRFWYSLKTIRHLRGAVPFLVQHRAGKASIKPPKQAANPGPSEET